MTSISINDAVNGSIEFVGALLTWRNVLQLWRDREIKGVYLPAFAFFGFWGLWNLYFYSSLTQWCSLCGSAFLVAGNLVWVSLAVLWRAR